MLTWNGTVFPRCAVEEDETPVGPDFEEDEELEEDEEEFDPQDDEEPDRYEEHAASGTKSRGAIIRVGGSGRNDVAVPAPLGAIKGPIYI